MAEARASDENLLALRISASGTEFILVSIYGPNSVDINFFHTIAKILNGTPDIPIIIGGDWNCTFSCNPLASNPDICDMAKLPNITHSKQIKLLCERFSLSDPFRCFHPVKKDFSFTPRSANQTNRSRIDISWYQTVCSPLPQIVLSSLACKTLSLTTKLFAFHFFPKNKKTICLELPTTF